MPARWARTAIRPSVTWYACLGSVLAKFVRTRSGRGSIALVQPHFQTLRIEFDVHLEQLAHLRGCLRAAMCLRARDVQVGQVIHDVYMTIFVSAMRERDLDHRVDLFVQVARQARHIGDTTVM